MFGRKNNEKAEKAAPAKPAAKSGGGKAKAKDPSDPKDVAAEFDELWSPSNASVRKTVEQLLLERGHIQEDHLTQARTVQSQTPGKSIAQILLTMAAASEAQILSALAEVNHLIYEVHERANVDQQAYVLLSPDYIRKHNVLPIRFTGENNKTLVVGMADPTNVFLIDEVKRKVKKDINVVATPGGEIARLVDLLTANASDMKVDEIIKDVAEDDIQIVKEV